MFVLLANIEMCILASSFCCLAHCCRFCCRCRYFPFNCREEKEIEFRDIAKLYEVDFRRSVSPHEPMDMCGTSSGQLLFADNVKAIRWTNPKSSGIYVSSLTDTRPYKMQHLSFEEKELLVVTYGVP